jgi:hypothetical protein
MKLFTKARQFFKTDDEKKKIKTPKTIKIALIKEVTITPDRVNTLYSIEVNDRYLDGSVTSSEKSAANHFARVVELKGKTAEKITLKREYVNTEN